MLFAILDVIFSDIDVVLIFSCYFHCTSPASNISWSHVTKTSSIFAIVVVVLFPVVVDFLLFVFVVDIFVVLPLVIVLPQVSRPGGSPRPELRAWLLWRLQVKRPIRGHPVRISAICRV